MDFKEICTAIYYIAQLFIQLVNEHNKRNKRKRHKKNRPASKLKR